jgi:Holliday junction resolvase RusA-like endonuclease
MGGRAPLDGTVDLRVVAFMPIPASWSQRKQAAALTDQIRPTGRPDADNILKAICDAIQGVCIRDDTIITEASIWKRFSISPRIVVELRALTWTSDISSRAQPTA